MRNERTEAAPRIVPVERLRLGDHAFMAFTDMEAVWQVLTVFTRTGLARREKVLIRLDPADLGDDEAVARLDGGTGQAIAARRSGQLVLRRNTSGYLPDGRFDNARQLKTLTDEIELASIEGWSGLRGASDGSWALRPELTSGTILDYEACLESLTTDPRLLALCRYDRRRCSDYVLATACGCHPIQVMERLDALEVTNTPGGGRIAGSAEPSTREEFVEAVRGLLNRRVPWVPVYVELDLTDLCFMEAYCGWQLISFAGALPTYSKVTVRCGTVLELVLRGLGCDQVPQLALRVEET